MDLKERAAPEVVSLVDQYVRRRSPTGAPVCISIREAAEDLGVGRNTVNKALRELVAAGELVIARKGTGAGYPTTYARS